MPKSTAQDLTSLVARKGAAAPPPADASVRSAAPAPGKGTEEVNSAPLNFRVSPDFRRRFKTLAAQHDLKLSELLRLAFEEYEAKHSARKSSR